MQLIRKKKISQLPLLESTTENTYVHVVDSDENYRIEADKITASLASKTYVDQQDALKVDKVDGKSLIADTEISRLEGVDNQTLSGLGGEPSANKQDSLAVDGNGVKFPTVDAVNSGLSTKPAKTTQVQAGAGLTGGGTLESDRTLNVVSANDGITVNADNIQLNAVDNLASTSSTRPLSANQGLALDAAKVDKVAGKSLILDTEITRLTSVTNQTLSGLGGEAVSNKTQTLTDSETDYPSGKAVKTAVDLKFDKDNLESVRSQSTSKVPSSKLLDDELNRQELYNITVRIPLTAGQFYTATTAIAAVPASVRKLGLKITYATAEGVWESYQFTGASTATWTTTSQWVKDISYPNATELLELPVAEVLNVLYAKIQALEAFIKASQYGNVTADQVDIVRNFNVWGKTNLIIEGAAAPTVVPDFVGQQFVNTAAGVTYTAKGIASVADWKQTSN